jgi:glycosyltransferase involved in cell wall biosynthesis
MVFVSFYTSLYEGQHQVLKASLEKFGVKYDIQKVASRGSWKANCLYRGQFLVEMMKKHNDNVVWIDADAELLKHPSLLFEIDGTVDVAWYDREGREYMLGTSYWKNTQLVKHLLMDWVTTSDLTATSISQRDFMRLFQAKYMGKLLLYTLPEPYCHIFDRAGNDPVIIHNQFSRQTKGVPEQDIKKTTIRPVSHQVAPLPEEASVPQPPNPRPPVAHFTSKKTVFLPLNQTNWAFDVRCTALEKLLTPYYNIRKVNGFDVARKGLGFHADLVYWPTYESLDTMGAHCHRTCATIGGLVVRSLDESISHFGKASAIAVPNMTWYKQYVAKGLSTKFFLIPNGVDINRFFPIPKPKNGEFIVGWAGNDRPDRAKLKRIEELRRICHKLGIVLYEQGRSAQISHDQMPSFYRQLDLYVNLSTTEGSNNCILEAAACGIPILGTKVGNMPELEKVGAFTVEQDLRDLEEKLCYIRSLKNRDEIGELMRNEIVNNYSSELMAMRYKEMFEYSLQ